MKRIRRLTCCVLIFMFMAVLLYSCSQNKAAENHERTSIPNEGDSNDTIQTAVDEQSETEDTIRLLENDPRLIGTWRNDAEETYYRIKEDGKILTDFVLISKSSMTINGVTKTTVNKSITSVDTMKWSIADGVFMFNGNKQMDYSEENGTPCLTGEGLSFHKVGDLDYKIDLSGDETNDKAAEADKKPYTLGTKITASGFEVVLDEQGIKEDIRVTSTKSGLKITSGPSVVEGKKYVYLKGTLKNTGKSSIRAIIGGTVDLDGYEYSMRIDTIGSDGSPLSMIDPLDTVTLLIFAEVPNEIANSFKNGTITFGFNDDFRNLEMNQADYLYCINVKS